VYPATSATHEIIEDQYYLRNSPSKAVAEPINPIYLFKLYLRFGRVNEANTIALAIIDRELVDGSYKSAHANAHTISSHLLRAKAAVNAELRNKIIVLHSYMLVKKALKYENHALAAVLLNRVCNYLFYLPKNDTEILTSAVIEATKAGFRAFAYNWALTLCKPQYRAHVNPKYKEKIERIALKPVSEKEGVGIDYGRICWGESGELSEVNKCFNCSRVVKNVFGLSCEWCLNDYLICISSGKAILNKDTEQYGQCVECLGVGYVSEVNWIRKKEDQCPMCGRKAENWFQEIPIESIREMTAK
jgi:WD repeat-containing protein 19